MPDPGRTYSFPRCDPRCDMSRQTWAALARGVCCQCGGELPGGPSARMLRAKRLIERLWKETPDA